MVKCENQISFTYLISFKAGTQIYESIALILK